MIQSHDMGGMAACTSKVLWYRLDNAKCLNKELQAAMKTTTAAAGMDISDIPITTQ